MNKNGLTNKNEIHFYSLTWSQIFPKIIEGMIYIQNIDPQYIEKSERIKMKSKFLRNINWW